MCGRWIVFEMLCVWKCPYCMWFLFSLSFWKLVGSCLYPQGSQFHNDASWCGWICIQCPGYCVPFQSENSWTLNFGEIFSNFLADDFLPSISSVVFFLELLLLRYWTFWTALLFFPHVFVFFFLSRDISSALYPIVLLLIFFFPSILNSLYFQVLFLNLTLFLFQHCNKFSELSVCICLVFFEVFFFLHGHCPPSYLFLFVWVSQFCIRGFLKMPEGPWFVCRCLRVGD